MNAFFNFLFQYLKKEEIPLDEPEFLFQVQSHPSYPSLLAISDTLSFFNIDNAAVRVEFSEIDNLPDRFVTLLSENLSASQFHFLEKNSHGYFSFKNKKKTKVSKLSLESRWNNMVFLAESSDEGKGKIKRKEKQQFYMLLSLVSLIFFSLIISSYHTDYKTFLFFFFPVIGLLFSVAALKDLFGAKSKLINNFCNITVSTSCTTVVSSDKWKIFKTLNFSDLTIYFFTTQFLGLFILILLGDSVVFFSIQKCALILSIPVILASLYYQKFVEKKWCPICLVIIGIIIIEMIYLFSFQSNDFKLVYKPLIANSGY
ncbi:hypothetical protein B0A75_09715, partial [Flavobacterium oncorhynchi]